MISIGLVNADKRMSRTRFYDKLRDIARAHPRYVAQGARLVLPEEDTAIETNWPRYGDSDSAYIRHAAHDLSEGGIYQTYLRSLVVYAKSNPDVFVLILIMHPDVRIARVVRKLPNVILADGSLAAADRNINARTVSMPSLPFVMTIRPNQRPRPILASFQGIDSHPVRRALASHANEDGFVIRLVSSARHVGKIDVSANTTDKEYEDLLDNSIFAFVPRGDALFSYRLLEVMARGAIPIVLSEEWVLPLDRTIDWKRIALRLSYDQIPRVPEILRAMDMPTIAVMQAGVIDTYTRYLSGLDVILDAVLGECEMIISPKA